MVCATASLLGCSRSIDEETARSEARRIVEENIRAKYDPKLVSVSNVTVIEDGANQFIGSAKIKILNEKIDIPFIINAKKASNDKPIVIVNLDYSRVDVQIKYFQEKKDASERKKIKETLDKTSRIKINK